MINKVLLHVGQEKKLAGSELTGIRESAFYSVRPTVWCCNYRERANDIIVDDEFINTTKEKDQRWSEWKYGLPTSEVEKLEYVPRKQPELQYLGKKFDYNPKNKVFRIPNIGQDITDMAKDSIAINNFNRESLLAGDTRRNIETSLFTSKELQRYFVFKANSFIPFLAVNIENKKLAGDRYSEFTLKNKEFYSDDDIQLSRDFKFPKLKWGDGNEFLLYYYPLEDASLSNDYKYIDPALLISKVNTPRLFSVYDKKITGPYTEVLATYKSPDFINNKVISKTINTNLKTINSCYITSDDNTKIFEIVVSRIFFAFDYNKPKNTITWSVATKLNNRFVGRRDKVLKSGYSKQEDLDNLEPSRFNLSPFHFTRISKTYLNSLALMEHSPEIPSRSYIEPFLYQPGTLPVSNKWQPDSLEQNGGYPRGLAPKSVEINNGVIEYKFDFDIKEADGNFKKLPNPENKSKYDFRHKNLVPSSELIL